MKKSKVILSILIIFIVLLFIMQKSISASWFVEEFENSINAGKKTEKEIGAVGGNIVGIIQVVGTMVAVGMLGILGIKYALGSSEQKAEYKKSMIPYLVGAILIFGFSNITQVIYEWAKNI